MACFGAGVAELTAAFDFSVVIKMAKPDFLFVFHYSTVLNEFSRPDTVSTKLLIKLKLTRYLVISSEFEVVKVTIAEP